MNNKQYLGRWGEEKARDYLERQGLCFVEANARTKYGELDIVTMDGSQIVFVEVKTRTSKKFGSGEQAITNNKQKHLIAAAESYMQAHPGLGSDWRIDAVIVEQDYENQNNEYRWYKNAVPGD